VYVVDSVVQCPGLKGEGRGEGQQSRTVANQEIDWMYASENQVISTYE